MLSSFALARMRSAAGVVLLASLLQTCMCQDVDAPLPLDVVLGPGQVRCGPVTRESELIGGPGAFGQVGRSFRCNNARIRFLVQDASRPVGNAAEGGTLLDVDLVRGTVGKVEADGEDTFRELVPGLGARETRVETIQVLQDGSDGGPGIIRVTGRPTDLSLAPQAYYLAQDLEGTLVTDYVLKPDASYVEIVTTFLNDGPIVPALQMADFVAFGGSTAPHSQEFGYDDVELFAELEFLSAGRGDHVSYALASPDTNIIVPFIDAGITAPFYGESVPVGAEGSFARWLFVGDGSLESTTRQVMEAKALPRGTVGGVVRDADGGPVGGAIVSALLAPLADARTKVINEARSAPDGSFTLTLPPGSYQLLAHGLGRARSSEVSAVVTDGGRADGVSLVIGGTGRITVSTKFTDRAGADLGSLPAKLTVVPSADTQRASSVLIDFERQGATRYEVSANGQFAVDVPPGSYTVYVTRGFEFSRFERDIGVAAGDTVALVADIAHVLDTEGLVGAEFHQHSLGSIDAKVPVAVKVLENAAEGIELASSTDHDVITDFRPHVAALGLTRHLFVVAGAEVSYQGIGHFNAYPWQVDEQDPSRDTGSKIWWKKTVPEMFADVRSAAGDPIIQINHPRSQLTGYFTSLPFNPVDARRIHRDPPGIPTFPATIYDEWSADFDAVEVNSSLGDVTLFTDSGRAALAALAADDPTSVPSLADYFALLGAGLKVVAMGNSDTHKLDEPVGYPRNFLTLEKDAPSELAEGDIRLAIRAQRNAVGEGCLIELYTNGLRRQGVAQMIGSTDEVRVRLQAPPHVTPGRVEVYVNGMARALAGTRTQLALDAAGRLSVPVADIQKQDDVERLSHTLQGLPRDEGDLVVVAVSRGGTGLEPTGGGGVMCYSAPLYVDVDQDGAFRPWLADTQDLAP